MRPTLLGVMAALAAAALVPAAHAQAPRRPALYPSSPPSYGPTGLIRLPTTTTIRVQTTVSAPDGGSVTVGGYSSLSEGRSEYGAPVVGKVPYLGRTVRNTGYGRSAVSGRISVRVRVIDLREEEYRQTGYRSP